MIQSDELLIRYGRVLAVDPRSHCIGWACFKAGELQGYHNRTFYRSGGLKERHRRTLKPYLTSLLDCFSPYLLIVPDVANEGGRPRSTATQAAINDLVATARVRHITVHVVNTARMKDVFLRPDGTTVDNLFEVYRNVADRYPDLASLAPKSERKPWQSEPTVTPLFNAVAMYLVWQRQSRQRAIA